MLHKAIHYDLSRNSVDVGNVLTAGNMDTVAERAANDSHGAAKAETA